jgi:hypothetical protein
LPARVAFIVSSVLMLAGLAVPVELTQNRSIRSGLHPDVPRSPATSLAAEAGESPEAEEIEPIDLYGNEVSDAVAKYKLDATGGLYELHSPQTEVPRLGVPKS